MTVTRFINKSFADLPLGETFRTTPTDTAFDWRKRSTRTAQIVDKDCIYYFRKNERCFVPVTDLTPARPAE